MEEIPENIRKEIKFYPVETMKEVCDAAIKNADK